MFVLSILIGLLLAPFSKWIAYALAAELGVYAMACIAASIPFARSVSLKSLLILPIVMTVYHVAYGFGFLLGVLRPPPKQSPQSAGALFTELTR